MPHLMWDSSALGKHYVQEPGAEIADVLFALGLPMLTAYLAYVEVANIIRRHRNHGLIDETDFLDARRLLEKEVLNAVDFLLLTIDDNALLASIPLADKHNLNSTDAALLYAFREFQTESGEECVLLVSDKRLMRAATVEGLSVLNPETATLADVSPLKR